MLDKQFGCRRISFICVNPGGRMGILALVAMVVCLFLIPLGLPGLWLMLGILGVAALGGAVGWGLLLLLTLVAGVAELLEFLAVQRMSARYGGSRKAFWGALGGGLIGALAGAPIPIIGSLVMGLFGTFTGAAFVTWLDVKDLGPAARVGLGALIGRSIAAIVKTAAGIVILVAGGAALLM